MTITITGGKLARRGDGLHSTESLAQSTATAFQSISLTTDVTLVGGGTATGPTVNLFSLADGTEGQTKDILVTATGEAKILLTNGTATGQHVLTAADDGLTVKFYAGKWRVQQSSATLSTGT